MDPSSLTRFRWPVAAALLAIAVVLLWPRGVDEVEADASPPASVVVGEIGGDVMSPSPSPQPSVASTPIPTVTPNATPTTEPTATPEPVTAGFEVLACRSISGSSCNDQLGTLPAEAGSFTALVRFTDSNGGDRISTTLDGPSGTIEGFPTTLQGGGGGYYYSEFQAGGLPAGEYTLTATHNGEVVAETSFRKSGG
jgi:hypothetical protein